LAAGVVLMVDVREPRPGATATTPTIALSDRLTAMAAAEAVD
jgi:hypothetical protein